MTTSRVTLIHFSDIHLTARRLGWRRRDWLSKRLTGWVNIRMLGRGRRFRHAEAVLERLLGRLQADPPDGVLFSGDATKLGFCNEFQRVESLMQPQASWWPPAVAVPGNHDYYVPEAADAGEFERIFAPWQQGERLAGSTYPFVRTIRGIHIVAIQAARANPFHLDASGEVGSEQRDRIRELSRHLPPGPRWWLVHYPLRKATGMLEGPLRRLKDHQEMLELARDCQVQLWLHGHIHTPFVRGACDAVPFPMICAGSATQTHRWSYHRYQVEADRLIGTRWTYHLGLGDFVESDRFSLKLRLNPGE